MIAIRIASPPAMITPVLKVMFEPRPARCRARPPPAKTASVARATVETVAMRRPAMISGSASGSSTRHSSWRSDMPMPRPGVLGVGRHVGEPGDDVAVEDLERVGRERDDRRDVAAAGDRQQQEEEGDAGDRVEDPRGRRSAAASASGGRCESSARRHGDREPRDDRDRHEDDVLERRGRCSGRCCRPPSSRRRSRCRRCSRDSERSLKKSVVDLGERQRHEALSPSGRSAAGCSSTSASAEVRNSEMISTDRTPGDRALGVDHRRVLRLGLQQVREGVAHDVVALDDRLGAACRGVSGTCSRARSESESQPSGRRSESTTQRVRHLRPLELRAHLGRRLADVGQRRLPEVDVGDAQQREALQRPVGADEVLDEVVGGRHQELGRGRVLGDAARPRAAPRSGRPS